jgi:hypothetical protein
VSNSFILQTVIEAFSSSALAHTVIVVQCKHFWQNFGPLLAQLFFFEKKEKVLV